MSFITRDDIDEAWRIIKECQNNEKDLIEQFGLDGKPKEVQESLCPELAEVRRSAKKSRDFMSKHN